MAFDPFHSERLLYRAVEDTDEAFLHSIQLDTESLSTNTIHLLTPQGKSQIKKLVELLRNDALLGVKICLQQPPKDAIDTITSSATTEEPTPIGFIILSKSHPNGSHSKSRKAVPGIAK